MLTRCIGAEVAFLLNFVHRLLRLLMITKNKNLKLMFQTETTSFPPTINYLLFYKATGQCTILLFYNWLSKSLHSSHVNIVGYWYTVQVICLIISTLTEGSKWSRQETRIKLSFRDRRIKISQRNHKIRVTICTSWMWLFFKQSKINSLTGCEIYLSISSRYKRLRYCFKAWNHTMNWIIRVYGFCWRL